MEKKYRKAKTYLKYMKNNENVSFDLQYRWGQHSGNLLINLPNNNIIKPVLSDENGLYLELTKISKISYDFKNKKITYGKELFSEICVTVIGNGYGSLRIEILFWNESHQQKACWYFGIDYGFNSKFEKVSFIGSDSACLLTANQLLNCDIFNEIKTKGMYSYDFCGNLKC